MKKHQMRFDLVRTFLARGLTGPAAIAEAGAAMTFVLAGRPPVPDHSRTERAWAAPPGTDVGLELQKEREAAALRRAADAKRDAMLAAVRR